MEEQNVKPRSAESDAKKKRNKRKLEDTDINTNDDDKKDPKRRKGNNNNEPEIQDLNSNITNAPPDIENKIEEKEDDANTIQFEETADRLGYLNKYTLEDLKKAYSCFISAIGASKLRKDAVIKALGNHAAFSEICEVLRKGNTANYVPNLKQLEASVRPPKLIKDILWSAFYKREDFPQDTFDSGRQFLMKWGIQTEPTTQISKLWTDPLFEREFAELWEQMLEPKLKANPRDIFKDLDDFYTALTRKDLLPEYFVEKALTVYQHLKMFPNVEETWGELDLEVKIYGIWHIFFAEFKHQADKVMTCLPTGEDYRDMYLYPDMLMTNEANVPCIFIENGVEEDICWQHKDTPKILAEGRLGNTYTLSKFETEISRSFLVLNGGKYMSVLKMTASLITLKDQLKRAYGVSFISQDEEEDDEDEEYKDEDDNRNKVTLTYEIENYSKIIKLFVGIYSSTKIMDFKQRLQSILFSQQVSVEQISTNPQAKPDPHTPGGKLPTRRTPSGPKNTSGEKIDESPKEDSDIPFPLHQQLVLAFNKRSVRVNLVDGKIRKLNTSTSIRYCGKVLELESGKEVPFEFRLMQKLNHPHIMKIHEIVFKESKTHCMAVTDWISDAICTRLCGLEKTSIAKGVLSALDYLHDLNIVHADVKLSNVVAQERDIHTRNSHTHPFLIDFGLSFDASSAPNKILGTYPYIAPEVLNRKLCSPAMDMWSYGLFLFELYFGSHFMITSESNMKQLVTDWYNKQQFKFKLVESLFDLIWKCLEENPTKRITAKQALDHPFWRAIGQVAHNHPIVYYLLGNVVNWNEPIDWETVAKEEKVETTSVAKILGPNRKVLGDITNQLPRKKTQH